MPAHYLTQLPPPNLLIRYAWFYRPFLPAVLLGAAFLILAALTEPLIPAMMKSLLDYTSRPTNNPTVLMNTWPWWWPPVVVVLLFGLRSLLIFVANVALGSASNKAMLRLQHELFAHLQRVRLDAYQTYNASSLVNLFRQECERAAQSFLTVMQDGVRQVFTVCALLAWLFWMNWLLTLVTLIVLPLMALLIKAVGKRLRKVIEEWTKASNELSYVIEEHTNAHRVVRVFGAQGTLQARFSATQRKLYGQQMRMLVASSLMTPITQISAAIALSIILVIALSHNRAGDLSVGGFAAYITAMLMLIAPLKTLGEIYPALQRCKVSLGKIFELLGYPCEDNVAPSLTEPSLTAPLPTKVQGAIEFRSVTKYYADSDRAAVLDVSLKIEAKQMVAFVGTSGSGKTSLINLLPRFIECSSGEILLDGSPINTWPVVQLREHLGLVSQDIVLINDSVLVNVSFGDSAPNRERAKKALQDANLWAHIEGLPLGMDTPVGHNGQNLSGGQRQRLAIARALYKAAPVLILDEATSALDTESERLVQEAIARLAHGCTLLVIAHRLSTVRHADVIVVMDAGRIVEMGSYESLVSAQGYFSKLVQQQLS